MLRDLWQENRRPADGGRDVRTGQAEVRHRAAVYIHRGDSIDVARSFTDHTFDVVYIDGDHAYRGCLADLYEWWPKVKKDGILAGDDYGLDDRWWADGVTRAVQSFGAEFRLQAEIDEQQFLFMKTE